MTSLFRHLAPVTTPLAPFTTLLCAIRSPTDAVTRFGQALGQALGTNPCLLASSGRTAFYFLLKSVAATPQAATRREVLLPAYTCPSLAKVVLDAGLQPRFVDISPVNFAYEPAQLAATLGAQTLAVVLVHPFGMPQAVAPLQTLAQEAGAVLIEDAAQSLGATIAGQSVGTLGDYGLFSFGPGKPLSLGGGGAVCARNKVDAERLAADWAVQPAVTASASLVALARLATFYTAFHPHGWWLATRLGAQRAGDHEASWGYARTGLTSAQAMIGLGQLPHLGEYNRQRRLRASQLIAQLQGVSCVALPSLASPALAAPSYLRFPVLVATAALREALFQQLWAAGIGVGRMYNRTLADYFPQDPAAAYPGAQAVAQRLLTLPTHHFVTEQDIARIGQIFRQV